MEERQAFVNVINIHSEQIVTVIEILSPTNKNTSNDGWETYRRKQQELLASQTNLIKIDLLRDGEYTVAVPESVLPRAPRRDYLTCLHRGGRGWDFEAWPTRVRERLPCIAVPLTQELSDVPLDLQQPFNRLYDEGRYDRKVNYSREPIPPLAAEDAAWADTLLRERSLRR